MQSVCSEIRFCEKSPVKRSFWKLGLSLLVEISWKTLVLEAWIVTFGGSHVENARFGSLDCHFWWKSRGKRSFWKLGLSFLVKISCKTLVLEAWIVIFGENLVENARFGSLHFVTLGENLVENARFGSLHFVTLGGSLVENARFGSLSGLQERPDKRGKQECQARVCSKSVKKECQAKSVQQECLAGVSCNSVQQECQSRNV